MHFDRSTSLLFRTDIGDLRASDDSVPVQSRWAPTWIIDSRGDLAAIGVLLALIGVKAWERIHFPEWMGRTDILNQYLPWWSYLGLQLGSGDIPGWNPYSFGGTPFLGDPQSGWMYLPVMVPFTLLSPVLALKTYVVIQLLIGGLSLYAFARILGFGPVASLAAAMAYTFGPFLQHNTYCCNIQGHVAAWIPLGLLGVELSVRASSRYRRLLGWSITGLAISQMVAGWIGQGSYYALLLVESYLTYRLLLCRGTSQPRTMRIRWFLVHSAAVLTIGLGLGAAALLPRLDINQETNLAIGGYSNIEDRDVTGTTVGGAIGRMIAPDFQRRRSTVGAVALALAMVGTVIAWRRAPVPYFAILSLAVIVLTLRPTPFHRLFYLLPRFQELHEHEPSRLLAVFMIGPAILIAAAIEAIPKITKMRGTVATLVPIAGLTLLTAGLKPVYRNLDYIGRMTVVGFVAVALAFAVIVLGQAISSHPTWLTATQRWIPVLLIGALFCEPSGRDLINQLRHSPVTRYTLETVAANTATSEENSAGDFLQDLQAVTAEPFRYVGYNGVDLRSVGNEEGIVYQNRTWSTKYRRLLIGPRSMFLRINHLQGYNPIQLKRTVKLFQTINGQELDYHDAFVLATGTQSAWLDVLTVRYFVVPPDVPPGRPDLLHLSQLHQTVFDNGRVRVLENLDVLPYSWIVHEARPVEDDAALFRVSLGAVDPLQTALLEPEIDLPSLAQPHFSAQEMVQVERYEADYIVLRAHLDTDGLVVIAEVHDPGWQAFVDGESVDTYLVDGALRGVLVQSGDHRIEFRYAPKSIVLGLTLTGVTALALLAGLVGTRRRRGLTPTSMGPLLNRLAR